jgi:hypothetical protein
MRHEDTANAIRMAVGMNTAHYFTMAELFSKLCQKTCDGKRYNGDICGEVAPYLDVFRLSRRSLECAWSFYNTFEGLLRNDRVDAATIAGLPSFRHTISPSFKNKDWISKCKPTCTCHSFRERMVPNSLDNNGQLRPLVLYSEPESERVRDTLTERSSYLRDNDEVFLSTATSLVAPFLDSNSMDAFDVVSCPHCPGARSWKFSGGDPTRNYMCIKDYPAHLKEAHGIDFTL